MLDVVFGQASDAGRVRPLNEDAAAAFVPRSQYESRTRGWMFAVADGIGGRDLGEVASAKAVEVVVHGFPNSPESASLEDLLPRLIQHANVAVRQQGHQPDRRGRQMATTIVCCVLRDDQAVISHVGDCRCYQVRDGNANLLTQDHTWTTEQRKLGLLTAVQAEQSEKRHLLTRSLGPEQFVTADIGRVSILAGDTLVLCTHGLYGAMYVEDIARIASQNRSPELIAQELVRYAVEVDGSDNATAQVIQIRSTEPTG